MPEQDSELEKLIQAVCWKLYLEPESPELKSRWEQFKKEPNYQERIGKIRDNLLALCRSSLNYRLFGQTSAKFEEAEKKIHELWTTFLKSMVTSSDIEPKKLIPWHEIVNNELKVIVREAIRKALSPQSPQLPDLSDSKDSKASTNDEKRIEELDKKIKTDTLKDGSLNQVEYSVPKTNSDRSNPTDREDKVSSQTQQISTSSHNQSSQSAETENPPDPEEEIASPPVAQWKYIPVPEDEPDKHDESYCTSKTTTDGLKLIGARVRGKMHKHNGTNCDDWFEFDVSGNWTIIAVSDGAGSKKFSRLGAKVSCQAAVAHLTEKLQAIEIKPRETKEDLQAALGRDASWAFVGQDIESVQNALHEAMKVAYQAVEEKANDCSKYVSYYKILGNREVDIKDLSATLLLAVHTTIQVGDNQYSLVLTCQVGDGMLAAISKEGTLRLLGQPDSGQFAGQTEFLTSKKKITRENLIKKTFVFPGNLKALMVMTDGVADDYFPNEPGILQLYGDLVLNQVLEIPKLNESEINEKLRNTHLGSLPSVQEAKSKFQVPEKAITADGTKEVKINYVDAYAKELGVSPQDVVASPALLWAGADGEPMCDECKDQPPEEKLRIWLDSYYRRGSFDDRTLVVLYREEV
jgi:Protein phosphatase 2C